MRGHLLETTKRRQAAAGHVALGIEIGPDRVVEQQEHTLLCSNQHRQHLFKGGQRGLGGVPGAESSPARAGHAAVLEIVFEALGRTAPTFAARRRGHLDEVAAPTRPHNDGVDVRPARQLQRVRPPGVAPGVLILLDAGDGRTSARGDQVGELSVRRALVEDPMDARAVLFEVRIAEQQRPSAAAGVQMVRATVQHEGREALGRVLQIATRLDDAVDAVSAVAGANSRKDDGQTSNQVDGGQAGENQQRTAAARAARPSLHQAGGRIRDDEARRNERKAKARSRRASRDDAGEREQRPVPQVKRVADEADPDQEAVREHPPIQDRVRTRGDDETGAQGRNWRPRAPEGLGLRDDGEGDEADAHPGHRVRAPLVVVLSRATELRVRQQSARGQFPQPRERRVERRPREAVDHGQARGQRPDRDERGDPGDGAAGTPPGEDQQRRPE